MRMFLVVSSLFLVVSLMFACAPANKDTQQGHKVLFYRNPMNPEITSPVPMKDQMGMDYVPVYAVPAGRQEETAAKSSKKVDLTGETNIVKLTKEEETIIGVKTSPVVMRKLVKEIRTVGTVAYDPELYVAQEEFLGALKLADENLAAASRQRLLILGMSEKQISDLEKQGKPQTNLILPEGKVWVYANFYEYEAGWLKVGQKVVVAALAAPDKDFSGQVMAIEPIIKEMTRTVQAKIEVNNSSLILKPNMYVDVYLQAALPQAVLSVPTEAVLDTGMRKLVYVDKGQGVYVGREVNVGPEASGYYPVLAGLAAGEKVVLRANFLIDSQSKLSGGASAKYGSAAKEIKTEHKH